MAKIKDVVTHLESIAPVSYQEGYDNSGLITGDREWEVSGVMITLDAIEHVIDEAIAKECNMVVAHHPIVFQGLKKITGRNYVERTIIKAIKNDIAIYAIHTNLDNISQGVNKKICDILDLEKVKILRPKEGTLSKLVTFIPVDDTEKVLEAMHNVGAGNVGEYHNCSFKILGEGTFKPSTSANPSVGSIGNQETVKENRVEVLLPSHLESQIVAALKAAHPYEEVAYYLQSLRNTNDEVGSGMVGNLKEEMQPEDFLSYLKNRMNLKVIRHTNLIAPIKTVAVCGGAGRFLLPDAVRCNADIFITSDFKYHEFFDADGKIVIADIGHYESEAFTKELISDLLREKFNSFAVNLSETVTNPINYY